MAGPDTTRGGASRRAFLGSAAAASAALAVGAPARAAAPRGRAYRERARIDVHAHHLAPAYVAALRAAGRSTIGGIPIPEWTPELALKFMDGHGIAVQLLSVSDPGVDFLPAPDAAALARTCNDYVAGVVRARPDRFGAIAVVSLQDVAAARAEVARALDVLEHDGIGLLSSSQGRYLGDPAFDGLLADLHRRRAWVFVHPTAVADTDKPAYSLPDFTAEYPFDTTRTIMSLLFNGAFHRYPRIRWHFAHGGGTVAMLRFRLTALTARAKLVGPVIGLPPASSVLTEDSAERALRRAFYDTALIPERPALEAVSAMAGVNSMLFGSDWPFAGLLYGASGDPQPGLSEVFSDKQRHRIDRRNARAQFRRLRDASVPT